MSALDRVAAAGYTEAVRSTRLVLRGGLVAAAAALCACACGAPPPERAALVDASVAAGVQIYPQLLARAFPADEESRGVSARPQLAYLSRSLCMHGAPEKLQLGPELQDLLTRSAAQLGMEARWVDSRAVFEHAEAADSGDALLCFGAIELAPAGAQVEVSIGTRDGSQEQSTYAFSYRDGRWLIEPDEVETP